MTQPAWEPRLEGPHSAGLLRKVRSASAVRRSLEVGAKASNFSDGDTAEHVPFLLMASHLRGQALGGDHVSRDENQAKNALGAACL